MGLSDEVARAWEAAAQDLNITVATNGALVDTQRISHPYLVYIANFGRPKGTICSLRDDGDEALIEVARQQGFFVSVLYDAYAVYDRDRFIATLDDWKWFGSSAAPPWYTGKTWGE
jgi:hypothetical protein